MAVRESPTLPTTTVLVVDDEPNLVDLVTSYLEREDYVVERAADGPSAVETARTLRPDLVVLDLMVRRARSLSSAASVRRRVRPNAYGAR
jgi:DNA-binding response OmpR family regulator